LGSRSVETVDDNVVTSWGIKYSSSLHFILDIENIAIVVTVLVDLTLWNELGVFSGFITVDDVPSLVCTIVLSPENNILVFSISSSPDVKGFASSSNEVLSLIFEGLPPSGVRLPDSQVL
jgi:hypothetical protein